MARPGEFTIRAYLAGKLDLSQAEAVADMIASSSRAAHALASTQMRGGYSEELESLREKLLNLTSLLELELDFSEEDVRFADHSTQLREAMQQIAAHIDRLRSSFTLRNAIREVAVAITRSPKRRQIDAAQPTSERKSASWFPTSPGTTRDVIEECANIGGVLFRFLDTAGIRQRTTGARTDGHQRARCRASNGRRSCFIVNASTPCPVRFPLPRIFRSAPTKTPDRGKQNG